MSIQDETVYLFGANVRPAAFSVHRAGGKVVAHDIHADWDLCQIAETRRIQREGYPHDFGKFAMSIDGHPIIYTGGLENYPELVDKLASQGTLWGNPGDILEEVRDPFAVSGRLSQEGLYIPAVSLETSVAAADGSWLAKPRTGAGGLGVQDWKGGELKKDYFLQQKVEGDAHGAIYLGTDNGVEFVGDSMQLILGGFYYSGSIGPIKLAPAVQDQLDTMAKVLHEDFNLRGLFGVDFALDGEKAWFIEVNPRWTASVEILESGLGISAIDLHRSAFVGPPLKPKPTRQTISGKRILFCTEAYSVHRDAPCYRKGEQRYADIPSLGEVIQAESPILTVFADGATVEECERNLEQLVDEFRNEWLVRA